eukprot:g33124.t1
MCSGGLAKRLQLWLTTAARGASRLVKCQRCWGTCCDPAGVKACAKKHVNLDPTCEDKTAMALLAMGFAQTPLPWWAAARSVAHFKASVTRKKSERPSESQKWQQLLLRAKRQQAARLRRE